MSAEEFISIDDDILTEVPIDNMNDIIQRHMNNDSSDDDESILTKGNDCVCAFMRCPDESIALTALEFGTQVVLMVTQCTSKPEF
ncbi:hypothetical protein AVEN_85720-1 [Araneus ventricosus]|uniref:Uncharacterized protein n=1 Tax=Araneus ventricosus TaxID=182803 RepID=A0A4Y2N4P0_ARAVE|nr:hypothetical protein AVEN_85720-1 [Araneus ventricosus]